MRIRVSDNWKTWREDRVKTFRCIVEESIDEAAYTAVDFSAATAKLYLRAWKPPADALTASDFVLNEELTKVGDGSAGKFSEKVKITADYALLEFALVAVDETVTGEPTPSTYQEEDIVTWEGTVLPSVQP